MKKKHVFVILHYCAIEATKKAVTCIEQNLEDKNYEIVIVDNASPDQSGLQLKKTYSKKRNICVILNPRNEGFAKGNNVGYQYAKNKLNPDFIIIMNNDVWILQKNFLQRIEEIYLGTSFHILGPDIISTDGEHQNPHRMKNLTRKDLNRIIFNRTIIISYLKIKKVFKLEGKINLIERWDIHRGVKEKEHINWNNPSQNSVLQGSCLIFSGDFIQRENYAFYPETFMWMEEEILTFLGIKNGYKIQYDPSLQVTHEGGISTNVIQQGRDKYCFYSVQLRKSAKILRKLMDQYTI